MRIAFLLDSFPELSQTFILHQATALIDAGHEIDFFAHSGQDWNVHADIHRYRLLERTYYWHVPRRYGQRCLRAIGLVLSHRAWCRPRVLIGALSARRHGRQALSLGLLYASIAFLRQKPYDIVHCQFGTLGRTALALRDIGAVTGTLVVSFRGADLGHAQRSRDYRGLFEKGDLFLPVCDALGQQLVGLGCNPNKIRVHHSGIKVSGFSFMERRGVGQGPTRLLTVGRLIEKKGIAYGIEAVARLKASGRHVRYTVAGDGELKAQLEQMISDLGLGAEIQLVGATSNEDVIGLLRDAHLFIAPSVTAENGDQEGIPNVLKEAMATGIPVVSTTHSGIPELVKDGVSGCLVPERDSAALADRLADLIDHPERWAAMGRAGRQRVEVEFDSEKLTEQLIRLYEHAAAGSISRVSTHRPQPD